jgi:hypothetical protein
MQIIDIREVTPPISSDIRNACIDFSKMIPGPGLKPGTPTKSKKGKETT